MRTRLLLTVVALGVTACGETPGSGTGGGAGGGGSSGSGGGGGTFRLDAGRDSGVASGLDAGRLDAGQSSLDAGDPVGVDAGSVDSGTSSMVDAGMVVNDGGQVANDGGQGMNDAGQQPRADAGQSFDAGQPLDAGVALAWVPLQGPRRGPIELTFNVGASDFTGFVLKADTAGLVNATVMSTERTPTTLTLVWDSFADVSIDTIKTLKLVGSKASGDVEVIFSLDVRNGLDPLRLLAIAQPYVDTAGGTGSTGTGVSLAQWPIDGGVTKRRLSTVAAVQRVRAAPHGRSTVVMGQTQVILIKTPLDADPAGASLSAPVTVPGSPTDIRWSRDGRYLYLLTGLSGVRSPTIERMRVKEDQSSIDAPETVAILTRPPLRFAIEPATGRFVVVVGSGPNASTGMLLLLEADGGQAASPVDRDWGVTNQLEVSPQGDEVVLTSTFNGDELFMVPLTSAGFGSVSVRTDVVFPFDVTFDPRLTARNFVVSNQDNNAVTSVTYGSTVTVHAKTTGIPLAYELDMVQRGTRVATGFVTSLSQIVQFQLSEVGTISGKKVAFTFDGGTMEEPGSISIQR